MLLNCGAGEDSWVPWTERISNQSILREISPECSLERLMLKLKLQYFGHLMQRTDSFEKTLKLGNIEGRKITGQQRMRWLMASPTQRVWVWVNSGTWRWAGRPGMLQSMGSQRVGHDWATELKYIIPTLFSLIPWYIRTSLVAQTIKRLSTMWETLVRSLGREDPLEKEMATHSSTLAWRIPWMKEPDGLQSMGSPRVRHDWATSLSSFFMIHRKDTSLLYQHHNIPGLWNTSTINNPFNKAPFVSARILVVSNRLQLRLS